METTAVLREQAGIQYQGVGDKSEVTQQSGSNITIVVGVFRRGRLDKPFFVTKHNVRSKLGYDPKNKDYMAVEDLLSSGVAGVYVLRVVIKAIQRGWGFNFGLDFGAVSK